MRPSSVPIQMSSSVPGESAIEKMTPNPQGAAFWAVIVPSHPAVPGTARDRSGLTIVHDWPRSTDLKSTWAPW
jgi:hypothetical protein